MKIFLVLFKKYKNAESFISNKKRNKYDLSLVLLYRLCQYSTIFDQCHCMSDEMNVVEQSILYLNQLKLSSFVFCNDLWTGLLLPVTKVDSKSKFKNCLFYLQWMNRTRRLSHEV